MQAWSTLKENQSKLNALWDHYCHMLETGCDPYHQLSLRAFASFDPTEGSSTKCSEVEY